jgi:hypothetical protein
MKLRRTVLWNTVAILIVHYSSSKEDTLVTGRHDIFQNMMRFIYIAGQNKVPFLQKLFRYVVSDVRIQTHTILKSSRTWAHRDRYSTQGGGGMEVVFRFLRVEWFTVWQRSVGRSAVVSLWDDVRIRTERCLLGHSTAKETKNALSESFISHSVNDTVDAGVHVR